MSRSGAWREGGTGQMSRILKPSPAPCAVGLFFPFGPTRCSHPARRALHPTRRASAPPEVSTCTYLTQPTCTRLALAREWLLFANHHNNTPPPETYLPYLRTYRYLQHERVARISAGLSVTRVEWTRGLWIPFLRQTPSPWLTGRSHLTWQA